MSRNKGTMETVTWMLVENTVPARMSNDSLTHALQFTSKIKKRTKMVNREIRKYSGLKSYNQYLDIKRSYLKNTSVDDESDYEPSSRYKIANSRGSNPDLLAYSSAEESEEDRDYDDILIGENPIISLSGREDENCSRRKESNKSRTENRDAGTRISRSPSIRNQHNSLRISVQPSTSRKSTDRKPKRVQTMLTNFLERKNISAPEETSSPEDEEPEIKEKGKENSKMTESPPKTRVSPRKVSKTQPESSKTSSVQKVRNKTREDVKKNLSAIIGDSETENLTEKNSENSDKNKLNETQDSDLNLSHMMDVAQSTQYPDDCSDISEKTEKKSLVGDFLTTKNPNQPKDSGIEDDSTEESAKLKGRCRKLIDNKKSTPKQKHARKSASNNINTNQNNFNNDNTFCLEAEDASEIESLKGAETLGNYENGFVQNQEPRKEKHPPKIIGSEIVDKKYKIVGKEQEGLTEIPEEEEEIDVVGMEQSDESECSSWKLKDRKIAREEEHGKRSNFGKDEKKKEFEAEKGDEEDECKEEVLADRVEDEIEESDEGLEKIKKFIIKKPIDRKLSNKERTPKKGKKSEKESKKSKKEKESIQEQNKKDHESHIFSSSESDFEEQKEGKESRKKQSEEKDDSMNEEGSKNEKQQEKRKVEEKVKEASSDDESKSDKDTRKESEKVKEDGSEEDQQEKAKVEEIRKIEEKVNDSSSEEDSESEKPEVKQKKKIEQEKVKESSSEEESEDDKEVKQKEIYELKNITERRKVEELKEDSTSSEEEKENEDPKLKLGVENNEPNLKIVEKPLNELDNIDSNDTVKIETENEDSNEVNVNSREIFTQFVDRKHDSESEEEKQDEEECRSTLEQEETYVNLDDNKITIDEHKIEVPENPDTSDEGEEVMSAKSLKKVQQMKRLDLTMGSDSSSDEEFSRAQMKPDKKLVRKEKSESSDSESEEDVKKKSPKKRSPKKEKSPKKKEIPKDLVLSSGGSEDDSKEDEKEIIKEVVQPDEDRDFSKYIQEGVSFFQQQKDAEKQRSSSQAIENIETQNLGSSQVISDPDTQISLENEKKKSKESRKKEVEAECLEYALSNLESANTKFKKGIEHQMVVDEVHELNKNDKANTENFQKLTELEELIEKDSLIEKNLPTRINVPNISDDQTIWMILIPEKEVTKNWRKEMFLYDESDLKLGKKAYKVSVKKPENLVSVLSNEESKMPYNAVKIRSVPSWIVRPKNAFINTSSAENEPERKRRKRRDTQDSSVNISKEVIHPVSNIPKKSKKTKRNKKKLFTQESMLDLEDKKPEDNEFESVNTAQKKKRKHFLSESDEEEKVEPKVDVKQKKMWNIDEYALDEKPPLVTPENRAGKSDVGLWEEKKPKKEKLKKEKKFNQFNERQGKSEASCLQIEEGKTVLSNLIAESSAKKEKYNSLDISKVKAKSDKEQKVKQKKKKILDKWVVEDASETEQKEEKVQLKNAGKAEKRKKKCRRDSEKLNDSSTENKIEKTEEVENSQNIELSKTDDQSKKETLNKQDSSSDFEITDKMKNKKKSKILKKSLFFEEYSNWDDLNNQKEIEFKQEKTKKTVNGLINFEH